MQLPAWDMKAGEEGGSGERRLCCFCVGVRYEACAGEKENKHLTQERASDGLKMKKVQEKSSVENYSMDFEYD